MAALPQTMEFSMRVLGVFQLRTPPPKVLAKLYADVQLMSLALTVPTRLIPPPQPAVFPMKAQFT